MNLGNAVVPPAEKPNPGRQCEYRRQSNTRPPALAQQCLQVDSAGRSGSESAAFLQFPFYLRYRCVSFLGLFAQAAFDDSLQLLRHVLNQLAHWPGLLASHRNDDVGAGLAVEGSFTGEHFVEHGAESEDIAARVRVFAL